MPFETMSKLKMHVAIEALPIVEDDGDGFASLLAKWGGMIVSSKRSSRESTRRNIAAAQTAK